MGYRTKTKGPFIRRKLSRINGTKLKSVKKGAGREVREFPASLTTLPWDAVRSKPINTDVFPDIASLHLDCEQSLFSQSSLSSAGLERANWPRGKLERGFPSAFARFARFPRSRFPRSCDHPKGLLAVYSCTRRPEIVNVC